MSGIDLGTIRYRRFDVQHADRLDQGLNTLEAVAERLAIVKPPFNLENVAASADAFHADLIVLDDAERAERSDDRRTVPQGPFARAGAARSKAAEDLSEVAVEGDAVRHPLRAYNNSGS